MIYLNHKPSYFTSKSRTPFSSTLYIKTLRIRGYSKYETRVSHYKVPGLKEIIVLKKG